MKNLNLACKIPLRYLTFLVVFSCFVSCGKKSDRSDRILEESGITFQLENPRDFWGNIVNFIEENDTSRIYLYSRSENKLLSYVVNDNVFKQESEFPAGPQVSNMYVHTPDSIFLFNRRTGFFSLLNSQYQILDTFTVPLYFEPYQYSLYSFSPDEFVYENKELMLSVYPHAPLETYYRCPIQISYSLKERKIKKHFLYYPSNYDENHRWGAVGSGYAKCMTPEGDVLFSFAMATDLFKYTREGEEVQTVKIPKSRYFTPPPPMDNKRIKSSQYISVYQDTVGYYSTLMYDPYRNVYLRVIVHPQFPTCIDSATNTLKRNGYFDRAWSIMFLDRDFHLIGEQKFEAKKYFSNGIFITREGILVTMGGGKAGGKNIELALFTYKKL